MTEGGTTETKHSQMKILSRFLALVWKILHGLHCPLTETIGLEMQRTGCDMSKPIATTELLEGGRGILCVIVCYQVTWNPCSSKIDFRCATTAEE